MSDQPRPSALLVRGLPGQLAPSELERLAADGSRPRTIYVEVARALGAEIIDLNRVEQHGSSGARFVARRIGLLEGQVLEAFICRRQYGRLVAFADRPGLELALLLKLSRSRQRVALVSSRLAAPGKRVFFRQFRVQTHLEPIISYSSVQLDLIAERYDIPRGELHAVLQPVDERFWSPDEPPTENIICAVGCISGLRDYGTLAEAIRDLPIRAELAVGGLLDSPGHRRKRTALFEEAFRQLPPNITYRMQVPFDELRRMYARSKFVVLPLHDVDFDAGVTSLTEAMAMARAVIVTRARGQVDVLTDGVEGIYVPPHDPRALREAITFLLDHPEIAARMGAAGRETVLRRHRLDDFAARVAEIVLPERCA